MLSYLSDLETVFGPARLFKYITFRAAMAGFTAMVFGFACAPWLFNRLRALKMAQSLRDASQVGALADLHAGKKNTPTMGGLLIFLAVMVSSLLWAKPNVYVLTAWVVYAGLTLIGFADDYLKVSKKNTHGVPSWIKLAAQGVITLIALGLLLGNTDSHHLMSELWVPFMKHPLMQEMPLVLIVVFFFFVMAGSSNAINLTDGVDGLAIGCTITVALAYAIMAYAIGNKVIADYLWMHVIPGAGELAILCAALVGAG
ncbi:MAG: phospho-N-acetylmuramoyl-pentapeptide-transferase, partial [Verrucomicrobia bacterium 21-51-4]